MLFDPMARGEVPAAVIFERRIFDFAAFERDGTARMEAAARRRVDRRWNIARKDDPFAAAFDGRVGDRNRREQRLGVGMQRVLRRALAIGQLDDLADVHHGDARRDVAHDREVVRDEQIGQAELR